MSDNSEVRFARLERAPAYKIVSDAILKDIIGGRLQMGNRLPSEQKLAEQFGVNRSTVREGIRLLEETGVLRREFGKRLVVSRPSYNSVGGQHQPRHDPARSDVPGAVGNDHGDRAGDAALAARKRSRRRPRFDRSELARTRASLGDGQMLVSLDIEFHRLIAQAAANRAMVLAREALSQLIYPAFKAVLVGGGASAAGPRLLAAHEAIAQAITGSDIETT